MSHFTLLSVVKAHLQANVEGQHFHLSTDKDINFPCCVLELEEIWSNLPVSAAGPQEKIKFKTICLHDETGVRSCLDQSKVVNQHLDGHSLSLKDGKSATIKLIGSSVDISKNGQRKTVSHFYESLIRG